MLNDKEIDYIKSDTEYRISKVLKADEFLSNNRDEKLSMFYNEVLRIYFYRTNNPLDHSLLNKNPKEFYKKQSYEPAMATDLYSVLDFAKHVYGSPLDFLEVLQNFLDNAVLDDSTFTIKYHKWDMKKSKHVTARKEDKKAQPYITWGTDEDGSQDASKLLEVLDFYREKNIRYMKSIVDNIGYYDK